VVNDSVWGKVELESRQTQATSVHGHAASQLRLRDAKARGSPRCGRPPLRAFAHCHRQTELLRPRLLASYEDSPLQFVRHLAVAWRCNAVQYAKNAYEIFGGLLGNRSGHVARVERRNFLLGKCENKGRRLRILPAFMPLGSRAGSVNR
jgi:hypothetical protein